MPKETFFNLPSTKRENIIDLSLDEFAANDYDAASISRIVRQAGIAKGSFYQYFADKQDLHGYLLQLAYEKKAILLGTPPNPNLDLFGFLRWLLEKGIAFELENPRLSQIGLRAVRTGHLPPDLIAQGAATSSGFFANLLAQAKAQGTIRPNINEKTAAFLFTAVFNQLGTYLIEELDITPDNRPAPLFDHPQVRQIFDDLLELLQKGLS